VGLDQVTFLGGAPRQNRGPSRPAIEGSRDAPEHGSPPAYSWDPWCTLPWPILPPATSQLARPTPQASTGRHVWARRNLSKGFDFYTYTCHAPTFFLHHPTQGIEGHPTVPPAWTSDLGCPLATFNSAKSYFFQKKRTRSTR
jgi:hypothetical protein